MTNNTNVDPHILSIDLETSGLDPTKNQILSIGMEHVQSQECFYKEIGWNQITVRPESMDYNDINLEEARLKNHPSIGVIDDEARKWVDALDVDGKMWPLGVNVLGFDIPFIEEQMPQLFSRLSYRGINLTSLWALWDTVHMDGYVGDGRGFGPRVLTQQSTKQDYYKRVAPNPDKHNALADARQAAEVYRDMVETLRNGELP